MSREENEKLKELEDKYNKLLFLLEKIVNVIDNNTKAINIHSDAIKKLSEIDFSL